MTDLWSLLWGFSWTPLLEASALILSIVNGFMLLRSYIRDRPKLVVKPIYPEVYQWFFKLPSEPLEGQATRKFGLLAYLDVFNRGLRDVSVESWNLYLATSDGKTSGKLNPININEPRILVGKSGVAKAYPVLGQKGEASTGEMMVRSGSSISGFAYYVFEYVGGDEWSIVRQDRTVIGKIVVRDIFGKSASTKIVFSEIALDKAKGVVADIDTMDVGMTRKL